MINLYAVIIFFLLLSMSGCERKLQHNLEGSDMDLSSETDVKGQHLRESDRDRYCDTNRLKNLTSKDFITNYCDSLPFRVTNRISIIKSCDLLLSDSMNKCMQMEIGSSLFLNPDFNYSAGPHKYKRNKNLYSIYLFDVASREVKFKTGSVEVRKDTIFLSQHSANLKEGEHPSFSPDIHVFHYEIMVDSIKNPIFMSRD